MDSDEMDSDRSRTKLMRRVLRRFDEGTTFLHLLFGVPPEGVTLMKSETRQALRVDASAGDRLWRPTGYKGAVVRFYAGREARPTCDDPKAPIVEFRTLPTVLPACLSCFNSSSRPERALALVHGVTLYELRPVVKSEWLQLEAHLRFDLGVWPPQMLHAPEWRGAPPKRPP